MRQRHPDTATTYARKRSTFSGSSPNPDHENPRLTGHRRTLIKQLFSGKSAEMTCSMAEIGGGEPESRVSIISRVWAQNPRIDRFRRTALPPSTSLVHIHANRRNKVLLHAVSHSVMGCAPPRLAGKQTRHVSCGGRRAPGARTTGRLPPNSTDRAALHSLVRERTRRPKQLIVTR